jgi:hypothetical protein
MRLTEAQKKALEELESNSSGALETVLFAILDKMDSFKREDKPADLSGTLTALVKSVQQVASNKPEVEINADLDIVKKAIDQNTLAVRKNTEALQRQNEILLMDKVFTYDNQGKVIKASVE